MIRKNPDAIRKGIINKGRNPELLDDFLSIDEKWRNLRSEIDSARAELNILSRERNIEKAKKVKERIKNNESEIKEIETRRETLLYQFPNMPSEDAPIGKNEEQNKVLRSWGKKPKYYKEDYVKLAERLDLIDMERGAKVAGSRFAYIKNKAVNLEFALINFALNTLIKEGFIPVLPPQLIKPEPYRAMGRLSEDQKEERYFLEKDNLYLIGSSEHSIGPMHSDEVFREEDLPKRYAGFSTCFRREAGSYGKDTRGILRVHQFDKIEMFSFSKPEDSARELKYLLSLQEKMMQKLKLPYRVVEVCTGDMGFTDAKQFDIEVWMPSENKYRETHSASNTTDFQARGVNVKYKSGSGANFVHMLNATGFSQRPILAILENFQTKKGSVAVPSVLTKYTGFKEIK